MLGVGWVKYFSQILLTVSKRESQMIGETRCMITENKVLETLSDFPQFHTYIKYDMFAVITLEPPISPPQLILPLDKCSFGNFYED